MLKKFTRIIRNRKSILENYKTAETVNEWKRNGLVPIPINYPFKPNPRYGYGNPCHKGLYDIIDDIYLPFDYPHLWSNRYYSEQYLLAVLLLAGNNRYEPILPSVFIENDPDLKKLSDAMWVGFEEAHGSGNGFWMLIR